MNDVLKTENDRSALAPAAPLLDAPRLQRRKSLSSRQVDAFARNAFRRFAEAAKGKADRIACKAGCSFCCRSMAVSVSLPEVFLLKRQLESLPASEFAEMKARIAAADDRTRGMTAHQRLFSRVPCPFLKDGKCSQYDSRPLSCRAAVSLDADKCRRACDGEAVSIQMPASYMQALELTSLWLVAAMNVAGLRCRSYELNAAMRIALEEPDAEQRWLDGEDVFAPAEIRES